MKSSIKYQGKGTVKLNTKKCLASTTPTQEWVKVRSKEVVLRKRVLNSMAFINVHI